MRWAQIRNMDISNGESIGVALFVQGCHFHCYNCFNQETWGFNNGYEWTDEIKTQFMSLINKPFIKRVSILGGEPLADENLDDVLSLVKEIRVSNANKKMWLYSGYTWEQIFYPCVTDDLDPIKEEKINQRREIITLCDVLVDGKYINSQRDITLKWCGSKNQRVIDVKKSFQNGEIILWTT